MKEMIVKVYRSIIVSIFFLVFGFGALFIKYCIFPFLRNKLNEYKILKKSWQIFIFMLESTGILKLNIKDKNLIENLKGSIIVSTHPSFVDVIILMSILPCSTCFVAEKLTKNPFLKGIVNELFIPEGQSSAKWVNDAITALNNGLNVVIFPMGIRHKKNETPRIKRGTALLALESKIDIIALKLENDFDFLQIHQPFYKAGIKTVQYNLGYIDKIDTATFITKYQDEVSIKTAITSKIKELLYS